MELVVVECGWVKPSEPTHAVTTHYSCPREFTLCVLHMFIYTELRQSDTIVCVCMHACMCACVCVRVCACVCVLLYNFL